MAFLISQLDAGWGGCSSVNEISPLWQGCDFKVPGPPLPPLYWPLLSPYSSCYLHGKASGVSALCVCVCVCITAKSSAVGSQEIPLQTSETLITPYSVMAHPTDFNHFSCPKLWSLPPQFSGTTTDCSDSRSLNRSGKLSPKRELGNCGSHLITLPSLRDWTFTLPVVHCLMGAASFILSSSTAV